MNGRKKKEPLLYLYRRNSSLDSVDDCTSFTLQHSSICDRCRAAIHRNINPAKEHDYDSRKSSTDSPGEVAAKKSRLISFPSSKKKSRGKQSFSAKSTQTTQEETNQPQESEAVKVSNHKAASKIDAPSNVLRGVSPDDQLACRLLYGRRCWSLVARHHGLCTDSPKDLPMNNLSAVSPARHLNHAWGGKDAFCTPLTCKCERSSARKPLLQEIRGIRDENQSLQEELRSIVSRLDRLILEKGKEEEQESVSYLMTNILQAQKERESVMQERLDTLIQDRDRISRHFNDLLEAVLHTQHAVNNLTMNSMSDMVPNEFPDESPEQPAIDFQSTLHDPKCHDLVLALECERVLRRTCEQKNARLEASMQGLYEKVFSYQN